MPEGKPAATESGHDSKSQSRSDVPAISLPKGGGAIRGIGEKFATNPVTGTGSMTVPITTSPGRGGFGPHLSLSYDSSSGNGPFGFGWTCPVPAISRKTDKGLPLYRESEESDVFLFSGAEDLVPELGPNNARLEDVTLSPGFAIHRYRPRVEGAFARIERWTSQATGETHWRTIGRDNVATLYGTTPESRIADPADATRVFSWLACQSFDDKGNAVVYSYAAENDSAVDFVQANERNRVRSANRYLKRIRYGNRTSLLTAEGARPHLLDEATLKTIEWLLEVVFDYDEGHYEALDPNSAIPVAEQHQLVRAALGPSLSWNAARRPWTLRPDPFSSYRAGFEVRHNRRCRRVLMFHRFAELGAEPCLVRSTEFEYADCDYTKPLTVEQELAHPGSTRFASFIQSVTHSGYVRDEGRPSSSRDGVTYITYLKKSYPPVEFEYSKAGIQDDVRELDAGSLENLPVGLDGALYQWVDLDGEGVSGILTELAGAWFYKPSLGQGRFGPSSSVATKPSTAALAGGVQRLLDLDGDSRLDLVEFAGATPGFYERTDDEDWEPFRAFRSRPNVEWNDPNLRLIDMTGDGLADVLITEDEVIRWHPSLGEEGFGPAECVYQVLDDELCPRLVFADATHSVYLADMSGDGLNDLVRVSDSEVCYWPNLGYGRFGAQVSMDNAPHFDYPDQFSQARVRLADVDGSGTTDLIYVGRDGARIFFNQAGNRWSDPRSLRTFPSVDDLATVTAVDLLGNGTACLVWSSPAPSESRRPTHYIDLMGGQKPHLLVKAVNNLGAETLVHYASSTTFSLADKAAGNPWVTKLPFPVHVVERVEIIDRIGRNRFVTRHAYHHGYFDGVEREFRGFGFVEHWDTESFSALTADGELPPDENIDLTSHVPPVYTKTWFHTGVYLDRDRVSSFFAGIPDGRGTSAYYREPATRHDDVGAKKQRLDDTVLPAGLSADEEREACRALRGSMVRQEVYGLDGSAEQDHPYTVVEQNFAVEVVQRRRGNRHAVFFPHAREAVEHHYERDPSDPRVLHRLTLDVDPYGNVLRSASVAYGRRAPDASIADSGDRVEQTRLHVICSESAFTRPVSGDHVWRTPLPSDARTFELTGLALESGALRFSFDDVRNAALVAHELPYEAVPLPGTRSKRLVEHVRVRYRPDDLGASRGDALALLPPDALESLALPGETYRLAFTRGMVADIYGDRVSDAMLEAEGRYVHSDGDDRWWIPSGRTFYSPAVDDAPAGEAASAREHFFLPRRHRDPFHTAAVATETVIRYDAYDLLVEEVRDALDNRVTAGERDPDPTKPLVRSGQDYRVLQASLVMDPNRNRAQAAFDALGLVVGTAVMGKPEENPRRGDSLDGFNPNVSDATVAVHLRAPLTAPHTILLRATTRLVVDLFAYHRTREEASPQPAVVYTLMRETHDADLEVGQKTKIQHSFSYSDGFGREIQKKIQAEPGPVPERDPATGRIVTVAGLPKMTANDVGPRWVGTGWTVFNNKGKPVRKFEPYFTDTHNFEFDVRVGVSPIVFYDSVGRIVATLNADHTWSKAIVGAWRQEVWDVSDTVLVTDPRTDAHVGNFFSRLPDDEYLPSWHTRRADGSLGTEERAAADKTAVHATTPALAHMDSLGRVFLTIAHNKLKYSDTLESDPPVEEFHRTRVVFDVEGNQRAVFDAKDRVVMRYDYDMLGHRVRQASMEAGERRMLIDIAGKLLYVWDSRDHRFRAAYDALGRQTDTHLREFAEAELLIERCVYGETRTDAEAHNARGRVIQLVDQAGVVTRDDYDFKGNLLRTRRQLAKAYSTTLDWSAAVALDAPVYASGARYDAFNRPIQAIAPHDDAPGAAISIIQPEYNEANLLERVHVWLDRSDEPLGLLDSGTADLRAVTDIDYDAKGQRMSITYGNGVRTTYDYDLLTFRLMSLITHRDDEILQDLRYTYDPAGHITHIRDDAQQTIFFGGALVEPSAEYTYDALSRLIEATGREHLGQTGAVPSSHSYNDARRLGIPFAAGDGNAMGRYLERYVYDVAGNFEKMKHVGSTPANSGWTRTYVYGEPNPLEVGKPSNRLTSTTVGSASPESYSNGGDGYDAHGNMLRMPHLQEIAWDFKDRLRMTRRQRVDPDDISGGEHQGERTWYVYDAGGQRVRKVTELAAGVIKNERIYLGGVEIFRRHGSSSLVRETLHLMDEAQRIALVETRTQGSEPQVPRRLVRFQLGNHLGSSILELDDSAQIVSYEEYSPYGNTSYQAVRSGLETPKRYRFTRKERDEENGFYFYGARYYAPWLGRWISPDPIGLAGGTNLMAYCHCDPANKVDPDGCDEQDLSGKPPPPRVPEVGKHPEGVLAESKFNATWEAAIEWRYKQGNLRANLAASRAKIEGAEDPSAAGRAEYKAVFDRFKREIAKNPELAQYNWEGTEFHHINPVKVGGGADPGGAVDPTGLVFAHGKAKVSGTSHNRLHDVPENTDPGPVRKQEAYAEATKGRPDGRPVPPAPPPASPSKATTPPVPAATPSPSASEVRAEPTKPASSPPAPGPAAPGQTAREVRVVLKSGRILKIAGDFTDFIALAQAKDHDDVAAILAGMAAWRIIHYVAVKPHEPALLRYLGAAGVWALDMGSNLTLPMLWIRSQPEGA